MPRLDAGNLPSPSRLGDNATVVTLDNPPDVSEDSAAEQLGIGQPLALPVSQSDDQPGVGEDFVHAHDYRAYANSVEESNDPRLRDFEDSLDPFIVPEGADSTVSGVDIQIRRKE